MRRVTTPQDAERTAALAAVEPLLRAHYIFPEVVDRVASTIATLAPDLADSPEDWAAAVTGAFQEASGDLHLRLHHSEEELEQTDPFADSSWTAAELVSEGRRARDDGQGIGAVERLPGNVGLLRMRGFVPLLFSGAQISAAFTLLAGTDALLVDLRTSRGGFPETVQLICSHFFDPAGEDVHLNDIVEEGSRTHQYWSLAWTPAPRYLDRPVYVLTSSRTFSAAEELAYNLKHLGRATVVGEQTRGGAHPSARVPVSPHFALNLPHARSVNPVTATNWEGVGVTPDVLASEADAYDVAYRAALADVVAGDATDAVRREAQEAAASLG